MSGKVQICGIDTDTLPKIGSEQCEQLLRAYKSGDDEAKELLIMSNMRLVLSIVQRYYDYKGCFDDLFQAGMLGLIKSIDNFDLAHGVRFSTYAVPMIIGEVRKYIRDNTALKVGRATRDLAYRSMQARDKLRDTIPEPTVTEIATEIAVPVIEVLSALDAVSEPLSIFSAVYNDGEESLLLMDVIGDEKNTEERLYNSLTLKDALAELTEKERSVILSRYYQGATQTEIAEMYSISQAQVSRLEKTALKKMREHFGIAE